MRHKKLGTKEYLNVTLYVVVMLAALFGNVAVVISVMSKHSLRVTVNLYLANLAVVDILICVCCMLVHMINHLTEPAYVLGPLICKFNGFAQSKLIFTLVPSFYTTPLPSFERKKINLLFIWLVYSLQLLEFKSLAKWSNFFVCT